MENGRWQRYASKQVTAWSKRTLPGWWTMFTFVLGIGFFLYLAHAMIADDPEPRSPIVAGSSPSQDNVSPSNDPSDVTTGDSSGNSSGDSGASPGSDDPGDGTAAPEDRVSVPTWDGGSAEIPATALEVAELAYEALLHADAARQVPTPEGTGVAAPAKERKDATVGELALTAAPTASRLSFTALIDVDGPASSAQPVPVYKNLARLDDRWVVLSANG